MRIYVMNCTSSIPTSSSGSYGGGVEVRKSKQDQIVKAIMNNNMHRFWPLKQNV